MTLAIPNDVILWGALTLTILLLLIQNLERFNKWNKRRKRKLEHQIVDEDDDESDLAEALIDIIKGKQGSYTALSNNILTSPLLGPLKKTKQQPQQPLVTSDPSATVNQNPPTEKQQSKVNKSHRSVYCNHPHVQKPGRVQSCLSSTICHSAPVSGKRVQQRICKQFSILNVHTPPNVRLFLNCDSEEDFDTTMSTTTDSFSDRLSAANINRSSLHYQPNDQLSLNVNTDATTSSSSYEEIDSPHPRVSIKSPHRRSTAPSNSPAALISASNRQKQLPYLPRCEVDGPAVAQMKEIFGENTDVVDIVRFLVARKGCVEQAAELMKKANAWHAANLPVKRTPSIEGAARTGSFFPHGKTKDGTPVLYFRGALYDNTKAPAEAFVLLAAHIIDWAVKVSDSVTVTVFVHTVNVPGAPNAQADIDFIKQFIAVLSDNFPERLKRLVLYPFPWYGRALWSVIRMFVDKRSQDKVMLLPACSGGGLPKEIKEFLDVDQVPTCCGGLNEEPILDILTQTGLLE